MDNFLGRFNKVDYTKYKNCEPVIKGVVRRKSITDNYRKDADLIIILTEWVEELFK